MIHDSMLGRQCPCNILNLISIYSEVIQRVSLAAGKVVCLNRDHRARGQLQSIPPASSNSRSGCRCFS